MNETLQLIQNVSSDGIVSGIGNFALALQALGIVALLYIIFLITNIILNRSKNKQLKRINENLEEIKDLLKKD